MSACGKCLALGPLGPCDGCYYQLGYGAKPPAVPEPDGVRLSPFDARPTQATRDAMLTPAVPDAPALPDGWRWYLCARTGAPYLVHMHDVELTLEDLRALLATQGLGIIGAKERAVLEAIDDLDEMTADFWADNTDDILLVRLGKALLARREGK